MVCVPPREMGKRKLKSLSITDKLRILEEVDKGCKKKKEIAAQFAIPASTLSTILKNRVVLQRNAESNTALSPSKKRFTRCLFEDVDRYVLQWALSMRAQNVPLTGDLVRQRARHFAASLGRSGFRASTGWLEKFKARHGILQRNVGKRTQSELPPPSKSMLDHGAKDPIKAECLEDAAAPEYVNVACDVIISDTQAMQVKREAEMLAAALNDDEMQTALETIRRYLDSKGTVPKEIWQALNAVENFYEKQNTVSARKLSGNAYV